MSNFDVIIIGGGPAGLAAALWCSELGLDVVLLEKEAEFGGQLLWTFNAIRNYLGVSADNGRELLQRFLQHIETTKVQRFTDAAIVRASLPRRTVFLADGRTFSARAIIIATGVRRRRLEVAGEDAFRGKGILRSGVESKTHVAGKSVIIVGGGDAAVENAAILSETARKVVIVHRRNELTARREFVERAENCENIEFRFNTRLAAIIGNTAVEAVELESTVTGEQKRIAADSVLIRIGVVPNTELFRGQIDHDDADYIRVDARCSTSLDTIFAIGDAANPVSPTIAAAAGMGAIAARSASVSLGASTAKPG